MITFRTQATNTSTTNVAYDLLPYNMASSTLTADSNRKWRHCHLMYFQWLHSTSCHIRFVAMTNYGYNKVKVYAKLVLQELRCNGRSILYSAWDISE